MHRFTIRHRVLSSLSVFHCLDIDERSRQGNYTECAHQFSKTQRKPLLLLNHDNHISPGRSRLTSHLTPRLLGGSHPAVWQDVTGNQKLGSKTKRKSQSLWGRFPASYPLTLTPHALSWRWDAEIGSRYIETVETPLFFFAGGPRHCSMSFICSFEHVLSSICLLKPPSIIRITTIHHLNQPVLESRHKSSFNRNRTCFVCLSSPFYLFIKQLISVK